MGAVKKLTQEYIVSKIEELPSLPTVIHELNQVISDPMASTGEIEKIMEKDQSITTKVLKLANSAYYAIPGGVSSLKRAIAYIGYNTAHQLVLSTSILNALEVNGPSGFDFNEFWKHSIGVGIAAETIAKHTGQPMPSDMFTGGLIHDMGKVALYTVDSDTMVAVKNLAIEDDITFVDAEEKMQVPKHTEVGKLLAEKWQLPLQMQSMIMYHHQSDPRKRGGLSHELSNNVDVVYLANLLIHALKFGNSGHMTVIGAPKEVLERLMITPTDGLKKLLQEIKANLGCASEFIELIGGQGA